MRNIEKNIIHAHSREMLELHIALVSANILQFSTAFFTPNLFKFL